MDKYFYMSGKLGNKSIFSKKRVGLTLLILSCKKLSILLKPQLLLKILTIQVVNKFNHYLLASESCFNKPDVLLVKEISARQLESMLFCSTNLPHKSVHRFTMFMKEKVNIPII